jgi:hypothetical protein
METIKDLVKKLAECNRIQKINNKNKKEINEKLKPIVVSKIEKYMRDNNLGKLNKYSKEYECSVKELHGKIKAKISHTMYEVSIKIDMCFEIADDILILEKYWNYCNHEGIGKSELHGSSLQELKNQIEEKKKK